MGLAQKIELEMKKSFLEVSIRKKRVSVSEKKEILRYLEREFTEPIRDPIWKHIYLSPSMKKVLSHPVVQRLNGLKQLGVAVLVYPGATHTRLNHSLGVFHIAKRIIHTLVNSPELPPYITLKGVKGYLSAALLHDIGHFPHAHSFVGYDFKEHEQLSGEKVVNTTLSTLLKEEVGCDPLFVQCVIDLDHETTARDDRFKEIEFFRHLLSGALDPDKLDYLNRDAYFCGVPYGLQDVDFVVSQMRPCEKGITISPKGVSGVEHLLFSKYLMYKTVYWHKTVSISTALIRKAVRLSLEKNLLDPQTLYELDDASFLEYYYSFKDREITALVEEANAPWEYTTIYEPQFDADNPLHRQLEDPKRRDALEDRCRKRLAQEFNSSESLCELFVDVAYKTSFELDIQISEARLGKPPLDKTQIETHVIPFQEGSIFSSEIVEEFTDSLRKIRFFVRKDLLAKGTNAHAKIIEIILAQSSEE